MKKKIGSIVALALLALACPACIVVDSSHGGAGPLSAATRRDAAAAEGGTLAVENRNGRITVSRDPTLTEVRIAAEFRCGGETQDEADARAKDARLVAERSGDGTVHVHVEFPQMRSGAGRCSADSAQIDIRAARLQGLELATTNGHVQVTGFAGQLRARTANGGIRVDGHDGPVQLDTTNGAIHAHGIGLPAQIETSNGSVDAAIADGQSGAVDVRTSNGSVSLDLPATWGGTVEARTSNGRVTLEGGGRATAITVDRSAGSMTLPGAAPSTANVRTSNGSVRVRAAKPAS